MLFRSDSIPILQRLFQAQQYQQYVLAPLEQCLIILCCSVEMSSARLTSIANRRHPTRSDQRPKVAIIMQVYRPSLHQRHLNMSMQTRTLPGHFQLFRIKRYQRYNCSTCSQASFAIVGDTSIAYLHVYASDDQKESGSVLSPRVCSIHFIRRVPIPSLQ